MRKYFYLMLLLITLCMQGFVNAQDALEKTVLQKVKTLILNMVPDSAGLENVNHKVDSLLLKVDTLTSAVENFVAAPSSGNPDSLNDLPGSAYMLKNDSLIFASRYYTDQQLLSKAASNHNHNGTYEPAITKFTGYLRYTGSAWQFLNETYSLSSHNHSGVYEPVLTSGTSSQYYRGDKSWQTLDKNAVGLGNVDNTSDVNKPISTATQTALDSKQNALVSGTNIRTVNGNSLLGSGDLVISGGGGADSLTFATQYDLTQGLATKQNNLVSGTNIRTVNGNSLIGSGNLDLTSGSGSTHGWRYAADYGAVGDGVTDDYNALRELFLDGSFYTQYEDTIYARLEAGKTYRISEGFWWQGDGGVGEQRVRYLHIDGQGSTIDTDTTSFVNGYVMHFAGYYNSLVADSFTAIPNNYNRGDLIIKLPASVWNGAQRGDIVWMMANSNYGGVDTEPDWVTNSVMEGELGEILYVNADTSVTLVERLNESYTSATTVIKKFFFPTVIIENLTLNAKIVENPSTGDCNNANKRAIDLLGVKNFIIRNVTIQGFGYESINVTNSMNGVIENYTARDLSKCNFGMNYGIAVLGCQDVVITKCNIKGGRHPIDFGSTLQLPGRRLTVSNSFLSADLSLSTSSLSTHPGVRDLTVVGNVIYGSLAVRSTHNLFSNNVIVGHSGSIQIANAWNPNGAYNVISDNYIEGDELGGIKVYTGNVGGCTGSYTITGNTIRAEVMVWIDAYVDGDAVQRITDLIIHDNDFVSSKTGTDNGNAIMIGQSAADTLIINNLSIQNNTIRNSSYGIQVYSPSSRVQINRFLVKNNNFYANGIIDVLSPAIINYLDVSGNTIEAAGGDALGGWVRPIWLRSGATVTTFKHTGNTYFDFGDMSGEAFVQASAGIITNWYYGGDIFIGATSFSEYGVTATNSYTIDWTP